MLTSNELEKEKKEEEEGISNSWRRIVIYIYLESLIDPFNSEVIEEIDFSMKVKEF